MIQTFCIRSKYLLPCLQIDQSRLIAATVVVIAAIVVVVVINVVAVIVVVVIAVVVIADDKSNAVYFNDIQNSVPTVLMVL